MLNHPIMAGILFLLALITMIAIVVIFLAKDITCTSDKALEEHYKRNKK